ncbi:MAG: hypothetical protein KGJ13_11495 [Patescibacteria group bacterium]|nr:hypothetical protein [Patescibacteria group bacterium]
MPRKKKDESAAAERRKLKDANGFPRFIDTLQMLCVCYRKRWPEYPIKVRPQQIKQWQNGTRLGPGKPRWHPLYNDDSEYEWEECEKWFEEVILPRYQSQAERARNGETVEAIEPDISELEDLEKRREVEHREWERQKERGEWIRRDVALSTAVAAVKKLHLLVKSEDERHLPSQRQERLAEILKAEQIAPDLADKICAEFLAWDLNMGKTMTDRRETAMELAGKVEIK